MMIEECEKHREAYEVPPFTTSHANSPIGEYLQVDAFLKLGTDCSEPTRSSTRDERLLDSSIPIALNPEKMVGMDV